MRDVTRRLQQIVDGIHDGKIGAAYESMSTEERRVYRTLRTEAERAIKGREIAGTHYSTRRLDEGLSIMLLLDGRHAHSVGNQVVRRFADFEKLEATVEREDRGRVMVRLLCA